MRVTFLDFDGVLNRYGEHNSFKLDAPWRDDPVDIRMPFEAECIERLNDIVRGAETKLVISSSWRTDRTQDQLARSLQWYGCIGEVVGMTPDLTQEYFEADKPIDVIARGDEIEAYLVRHPEVTEFVILDDVADMGRLTPCLVQTHMALGLTYTDVAAAIQTFAVSTFYARLVRAV